MTPETQDTHGVMRLGEVVGAVRPPYFCCNDCGWSTQYWNELAEHWMEWGHDGNAGDDPNED